MTLLVDQIMERITRNHKRGGMVDLSIPALKVLLEQEFNRARVPINMKLAGHDVPGCLGVQFPSGESDIHLVFSKGEAPVEVVFLACREPHIEPAPALVQPPPSITLHLGEPGAKVEDGVKVYHTSITTGEASKS